MTAYKEKFLDPRWQKKRLEILERDDFACQSCGDTTTTLHIHHRKYIKGYEPWDYPGGLLITLCATCHEAETESLEESLSILKEVVVDKFFAGDILEIASGFDSLRIRYESGVTARIVGWILSSDELMDELTAIFFKETQRQIEAGIKNGEK